MKFGIIKERKNPPDRRVVFSPSKLQEFKNQYPNAEIAVESSDIRVFSDNEYRNQGIDVTENMQNCDVLFGVKEVPIDALIPNKKYFFFSHTIKKQWYNRDLLKTILDKNIELYDHETIVKENGARLIGFGRYAGIVGAYNGFRAIGLKNGTYDLPKAENLDSQKELINELCKINLPKGFKILLTGNGKVAYGAKEMLDAMLLKAENGFLEKETYRFDYAVIIQQVFSLLFAIPQGWDEIKLLKFLVQYCEENIIIAILENLEFLGWIIKKENIWSASTKLMNLGAIGQIHSNIPDTKACVVINILNKNKIGEVMGIIDPVFLLAGNIWRIVHRTNDKIFVKPVTERYNPTKFKISLTKSRFDELLPENLHELNL